MQLTIAYLGLVAVAGAIPHPAQPKLANARRQIGGGLGGNVGGLSGTLTGEVPATGLPYGCLGLNGVLLCAREEIPAPTAAPELKNARRQIGGGLGGSVPGAAGSLSGTIGASGLAGGLGGSVPGATGTLTGVVPATGVPYGCIGLNDVTVCASDPVPVPTTVKSIALGTAGPKATGSLSGVAGPSGLAGGAGGSVPGATGALSGSVGPTGLGGGLGGNVPGATGGLSGSIGPTGIGGGLGGSIPGLTGTLTGFIPATGLPYGCIGFNGLEFCARRDQAVATAAPVVDVRRQIGGGLGGSVPGFTGALSGVVLPTGMPYGCLGGNGVTFCAREALAAPTAA